MRKLLTLICFCLLVATTAFSNPLSDYFIKESVGMVVFGNEDAKYLLGLSGEQTATTMVSKELVSALKDKFAIDIEKDVEQMGLFVVPCPKGDGTQIAMPTGGSANIDYEPIVFLCGEFDPKTIVPVMKKLIASTTKEPPKMDSINIDGKKINALFSKDNRLIFFRKTMLLICRDKAVSLMEQNKITFSKAPDLFNGLQERSKSFLLLKKPLVDSLASLNLPISGLETVESLSGYLNKNFIIVEAGFKDEASAKNMLNNVDKYKKEFYQQQNTNYENAKSNIKTVSIEKLFDEVNKLYSAAKNKDIVDNLKISLKGCSIVFEQPYDKDDKMVLAVGGIGILAAAAIPNFKAARGSAREKACFSNQRVLTGAVEMYNMDHSTMMSTLDIPTLVKEGYLKTAPSKPEPDCDYFSKGDLTTDGCIFCKRHGSVMQQQ